MAVAIAIVTAGLAFSSGRPASAHAILESSSPADQSIEATSPSKVTLTFSESVTLGPGAVRVFDGSGGRVDDGLASHGTSDTKVEVGLKPDLPSGSYAVAWQVVSADSHPVQGGFVFSVRDATQVGTIDQYLQHPSMRGWEAAGDVLRALTYLGSFLVVGGAIFVAFVDRGTPRRVVSRAIWWSADLAGIAVLLQVPVQAALATGLGFGSLVHDGVARQVLGDGVGLTVLGVLVAIVWGVAGVSMRSKRASRVAAVLALVVLTGAFIASGHTRTTQPAWLTSLVDVVHVAGGTLWVGGLAMLVLTLWADRRGTAEQGPDAVEGAKTVVRFSHLATAAIIAVGASGLILAWLEIGSFSGLFTTGYGWLVFAKFVALVLIGLLGAYNHFRLVPAVQTRPEGRVAWRHLTRTMRWEALGMVVILGLTGVLVNAVPSRTVLVQRALYSGTAALGSGSVNIVIQPAHTGPSEMHVYLLDAQGRPDDHQESVTVEMTQSELGIGPFDRALTKAGPGHYQLSGTLFTVPGSWRLVVRERVDDFTEHDATLQVVIRG